MADIIAFGLAVFGPPALFLGLYIEGLISDYLYERRNREEGK